MALLLYNHGGADILPHCGGTLISKTWVVTAAHCFHNVKHKLEYVRYRLGKKTLAPAYVDMPVKHAISHPLFLPSYNYKYDVGLVQLQSSLEFSDFIRPICLPYTKNKNYRFAPDLAMDISGWGLHDNVTSTISEHKMKAQMRILEDEVCERKYGLRNGLSSLRLCAEKSGTTTCHGDSGGPFMEGDNYYLGGIISVGIRGCSESAPVIGVNIINFISWIREEMARELNFRW